MFHANHVIVLLELLIMRNLRELAAGSLFGGHAYGFAFRESSFIPWAFTQAITVLQETGGLDQYFSSETYKIGSAGIGILDGDCGVNNAGVNAFLPDEFFGLTLICGIGMMVGLMQVIQRFRV